MQFINILPNADTLKYEQPMEMYLAQTLIGDDDLCAQIKSKESFKILDNGCYELNSSIAPPDILTVADKIGADEIILPDVMGDCIRTITKVCDAITYLHKVYGPTIPFSLMAVVQGDSIEEYMYCVGIYSAFSEITTIGIPKKFLRDHYDTIMQGALERGAFVKTLKENSVQKQIHLLGLSWGIMELPWVSEHVRSVDTNFVAEISKCNKSIWDTWDTFGETYTLDASLEDNWEAYKRNTKLVEEYLNGRNN